LKAEAYCYCNKSFFLSKTIDGVAGVAVVVDRSKGKKEKEEEQKRENENRRSVKDVVLYYIHI